MKDMPCKGEKPALLPVVLDPAAAAALQERNKQPGGKAYNDIMDQKSDYEKKKNGEVATKHEPTLEAIEEEPAEPKGEDFSNGPIAPKYSLLHSYPVEMGQFFNQGVQEIHRRRIPNQLTLKVQLPAVESVAELECDIKSDSFRLDYKNKYFLSIDFSYIVNENSAKAKYISAKNMLKITIPVIRAKNPVVEEEEKRLDEEERERNKQMTEEIRKQQEEEDLEEQGVKSEGIEGNLEKKF